MPPGAPINTLPEISRLIQLRYKMGHVASQPTRQFALRKFMHDNAVEEAPRNEKAWKFLRKTAEGSVQDLQPYGDTTGRYEEYDGEFRIGFIEYTTHNNLVLNETALARNQNDPGKIVDDYDIKNDANALEAAKDQEAMYLQAPAAFTSGGKANWNGLLGIFARSMTSGGVYTEQPIPARNGVYRRLGNGSVSSLIQTADAAALPNSPARTIVGTHNGAGPQLLEAIDEAVRISSITYLPELKGDRPPTGAMTILWGPEFHGWMRRIINDLGAAKRNNYFGGEDFSPVEGVKTIEVPSFEGHFLRPIFGVKPMNYRIIKHRGLWDKERKLPFGFNSMRFPRQWNGQAMAIDPSQAGFLIHGSFSTGT